eukprot:TRINITY_DN22354_c0_g1_i1.p1 TRINITY_DN22354_c0_g1~~TRINITY_DN22354_c0_g1_i1.p1  ORF type:complete len:901 (-),score=189.31 TRINITY_DN22354_c0_g1_i1:111-2579(-)
MVPQLRLLSQAVKDLQRADDASDHRRRCELATQACELALALMQDSAAEVRIHAYEVVPCALALLRQAPGASIVENTSATPLEKQAFVLLLVQLSLTSEPLRLAALHAMDALPVLDTESFGRAVKVPNFRKVASNDGQANAMETTEAPEIPEEQWFGALYFTLDDESPLVRAALLRFLGSAARRKELSSETDDASAKKAMYGTIQRLATIAAECLVDDHEPVRVAAGETLVSIMTHRALSFELMVNTRKKTAPKNVVSIAAVLQTLSLQRQLAFKVLDAARFASKYVLEQVIERLLTLPQLADEEGSLLDLLARMGRAQAQLLAFPGGCLERNTSGAKVCGGIGHRLFARYAAATARSPVAESHAAPALVQVQRLIVLLKSAIAEVPELRYCFYTTNFSSCGESAKWALELSSISALHPVGAAGVRKSVIAWVKQLASLYGQLRDVGVGISSSDKAVRRGLQSLRSTCNREAAQLFRSAELWAGPLLAIGAWAKLFLIILDAFRILNADADMLESEHRFAGKQPRRERALCSLGIPSHSQALLDCGEEIHKTISSLMFTFSWAAFAPDHDFPQSLLPFRHLSLGLFALAAPHEYAEDFAAFGSTLGAAVADLDTLQLQGAAALLPPLEAEFFELLLCGGAPPVLAHSAELKVPAVSSTPRRFAAALGGSLAVEVMSTVPRGLWVRASMPCAAVEAAEDCLQTASPLPALPETQASSCSQHPRTRVCEVPLRFPWIVDGPCAGQCATLNMTVQLVLSVDACAAAAAAAAGGGSAGTAASEVEMLQRGGTGIASSRPLYRRLNEVPLGVPLELPFEALPLQTSAP